MMDGEKEKGRREGEKGGERQLIKSWDTILGRIKGT